MQGSTQLGRGGEGRAPTQPLQANPLSTCRIPHRLKGFRPEGFSSSLQLLEAPGMLNPPLSPNAVQRLCPAARVFAGDRYFSIQQIAQHFGVKPQSSRVCTARPCCREPRGTAGSLTVGVPREGSSCPATLSSSPWLYQIPRYVIFFVAFLILQLVPLRPSPGLRRVCFNASAADPRGVPRGDPGMQLGAVGSRAEVPPAKAPVRTGFNGKR